MNIRKKLIIIIAIVAVIGILALVYGLFLSNPELASGDKTVLVLAVDESEPRLGLGAVDMAYVVYLKDGNIDKSVPIYPGGLRHPSKAEPAEAQAQGAGAMMLLHDALWTSNNDEGMQNAREIVEHNTGMEVDAVVAITTEGLDAIIDAAGGIKINGTLTDMRAVDLLREEQNERGVSRGGAVSNLANVLLKSAQDPSKRGAMTQAALAQFAAGNIVASPTGSFASLIAYKGLGAITG